MLKTNKCPVCGTQDFDGTVCRVCGLDYSVDYAQYRTISPIPSKEQSENRGSIPSLVRSTYNDRIANLEFQFNRLAEMMNDISLRLSKLEDTQDLKRIETPSEEQLETGETVLEPDKVGPIFFGSYAGKPLEWIAVKQEKTRVLLLSRYAIAFEPYHEKQEAVTWRDCTIQRWLNSSFANESFTTRQKMFISQAEIDGDRYDVFLLSSEEVKASAFDLRCYAADYANQSEYPREEDGCDWWLRFASGQKMTCSTIVHGSGFYTFRILNVTTRAGIRPAIWIYTGEFLRRK
jgi:uncharacterized Zn finger protein (UPF0148 family)